MVCLRFVRTKTYLILYVIRKILQLSIYVIINIVVRTLSAWSIFFNNTFTYFLLSFKDKNDRKGKKYIRCKYW